MFLIWVVFSFCGAYRVHVGDDPNRGMFVDENECVRLFHGVNIVHKTLWKDDISDDDLVYMRVFMGMNAIRLGLEWGLIEPARGNYNTTYLEEVQLFVERVGASGFDVIIELHQDVWGPLVCGNGAPSWATLPSEESMALFPLPVTRPCPQKHGAPLCDNCTKAPIWWGSRYFSFATSEAFQALYDNKKGIQDAWLDMWTHVASVFTNSPHVLGYEILNEPWMGDLYHDPLVLTKAGHADVTNLQPLYTRTHEAIRSVDAQHLIFFEPSTRDTQLFPAGSGFTEGPGGPGYNDRQVFSWHHYCPLGTNPSGGQRVLCDNVFAHDSFKTNTGDARALGGGAFLSEFGAVNNNDNGFHEIDAVLSIADTYRYSWTYWHWGDAIRSSVGVHLARPYPIITAGQLIAFSFSNDTKLFRMKYLHNSTLSSHGLQTEVFVAAHAQYNGSVSVTVQPHGKLSTKFTADSQVLCLRARSDLKDGAEVHVLLKRGPT